MPAGGRLGDKALCSSDAHGCPGCPHPVIGPAVTGSPDVFINGKPALRVNDRGIHSACCGSNTWEAISGSESVFINGKPAHRVGDKVQHCGGIGELVEGSENVFIGGENRPGEVFERRSWIEIRLLDEAKRPVPNVRYMIVTSDGKVHEGMLDEMGRAYLGGISEGECEVSFPELEDDEWR